VATESADCERIFSQLDSALKLLRRYDPRAHDALRKETGGIFVFGTAGVYAEWWRDERLIVMQPEYISDPATSPADVAATLVHEATHAWLERVGFQYTTQRRARLESICFRRELRFARRVPDAGDLVARLEQQLTCDPEYLTDEAFRERAVAELQRLGVPNWLFRMMEGCSRRLHRLTSAWSRTS
jgi:hypothetical protein